MVEFNVKVTLADNYDSPEYLTLWIDDIDADDPEYIEMEAQDSVSDLFRGEYVDGIVEVTIRGNRYAKAYYDVGDIDEDSETTENDLIAMALDWAYYDLTVEILDSSKIG